MATSESKDPKGYEDQFLYDEVTDPTYNSMSYIPVSRQHSPYKFRINISGKDYPQAQKPVLKILQDLMIKYHGVPVCIFKYIKFRTESEYYHHNPSDLATLRKRFLNGGQFTLYLNTENIFTACLFMLELEKRLRESGFSPGQSPKSDISISESSFISARQDHSPGKYISASHGSKDEVDAMNEQFKQSTLFQLVDKCFKQKIIPSELILAIANEVEGFNNRKGFFSIGMGSKADRIQRALNNAMENLGNFQSMDEFVHYKNGSEPSIQEALESPRLWFFNKPLWGETNSWGRVNRLIHDLNKSSSSKLKM